MKGPNGETIYFKCYECGAVLYTEGGIQIHMRNVHGRV